MGALPPSMIYSRSQYHVHKDQRTLLVHLHAMRNTVERHAALLKLSLVAADTRNDFPSDLSAQYATLMDGAKGLSQLFSDALDFQVVLDPQMAMHAYNGLESEFLKRVIHLTSSSAFPAHAFEPLRHRTGRLTETIAALYGGDQGIGDKSRIGEPAGELGNMARLTQSGPKR